MQSEITLKWARPKIHALFNLVENLLDKPRSEEDWAWMQGMDLMLTELAALNKELKKAPPKRIEQQL